MRTSINSVPIHYDINEELMRRAQPLTKLGAHVIAYERESAIFVPHVIAADGRLTTMNEKKNKSFFLCIPFSETSLSNDGGDDADKDYFHSKQSTEKSKWKQSRTAYICTDKHIYSNEDGVYVSSHLRYAFTLSISKMFGVELVRSLFTWSSDQAVKKFFFFFVLPKPTK